MNKYENMTAQELENELSDIRRQLASLAGLGLKLDLTRGKPGEKQLDLSEGMLTILSHNEDCISENGVDYLYYFDADGYIVYGIHPDNDGNLYVFDLETGRHRADLSGLYTEGEDTYYVDGGIAVKNAGLVLISEQYYYFGADGKAFKNGKFEISNLNGLDIEAGEYTFDEAGRIVLVTVVKGDVVGTGKDRDIFRMMVHNVSSETYEHL